jgi:tetratricopeptide (TPR) repeat protein
MRAWPAAWMVLVVAGGASAHAHSPSLWERAADPRMALADEVHREVEARLMMADRFDRGAGVDKLHRHTPMALEELGKAMQRLKEAHADGSPDVRLRFDLGRVAESLGDEKAAAPVLKSALLEAPDHPLATRAYFSQGICFAKLGLPEEEIVAYDKYLARETDPLDRALALSNRAEAEMYMARLLPPGSDYQGRLTLAINDYRAALSLEPSFGSAHWGLAVALDRSGDTPGGLAEAKIAITFDPLDQLLTGPDIFFVPSYDLNWYEAMSAIARAQQVDDAITAILWWETAVAKWATYVAVAASDDRWLSLAKAHQASSQRELGRAKKRGAHAPKLRHLRGDEVGSAPNGTGP